MSYAEQYFDETKKIIDSLDLAAIEKMVELLIKVREKNGRIFFIGVGGGAGNSTHAVNDFRKIASIEAYTPVDNVSELTARANDDGLESIFIEWLRVSKLTSNDMVFVFSVGGGCQEKMISINIIKALEYAKSVGAYIAGVVGRDGGYTSQVADACVIIPIINPLTVTPHTEAFQAVVWHLLVSHPKICINKMKWESLK
jgi:D-sedoheptulose 7-phosphate isomerase